MDPDENLSWLVHIITAARIGRGIPLRTLPAGPPTTYPPVHMFTPANQMAAVLDTKHGDAFPPVPATLNLRRRTRLSKVHRVLQADSGAGPPSRPLHRYFRREEPPSDMGANARTGTWGLGIRKRYAERAHPTHEHRRTCLRFISHHGGGLLHHRCTEGLHTLPVHEGGSHLSHASGLCVFVHGSHDRIWLAMILLGYPFWAIVAWTCFLAVGAGFEIASVRGYRRCSANICMR